MWKSRSSGGNGGSEVDTILRRTIRLEDPIKVEGSKFVWSESLKVLCCASPGQTWDFDAWVRFRFVRCRALQRESYDGGECQ